MQDRSIVSVSTVKTKIIALIDYFQLFLESGEYCMSGSQDRKVYLWNPFSNDPETLIQTYTGHSWEINDISM